MGKRQSNSQRPSDCPIISNSEIESLLFVVAANSSYECYKSNHVTWIFYCKLIFSGNCFCCASLMISGQWKCRYWAVFCLFLSDPWVFQWSWTVFILSHYLIGIGFLQHTGTVKPESWALIFSQVIYIFNTHSLRQKASCHIDLARPVGEFSRSWFVDRAALSVLRLIQRLNSSSLIPHVQKWLFLCLLTSL